MPLWLLRSSSLGQNLKLFNLSVVGSLCSHEQNVTEVCN